MKSVSGQSETSGLVDKPPAQAFLSLNWFHGPTTAWIVLGISILITVIAWAVSNKYARQLATERFQFQIVEAQNAIKRRFVNYEQVLLGGLGLFKASNHVSRKEWHDYIKTLNIDTYFPGTLGVGYADWIKPTQLNVYTDSIRMQGFPNFKVYPVRKRDQYSSITYLEPFNKRNQRAFGYDMYSEPVRREAMARARDSGTTALSGKVTLVQEITSDVQAGILIYIPRYSHEVHTVAERRKALLGFVYSALRVGDLMHGILGVGLPELDFRVYDGSDTSKTSLIYDSDTEFTNKDANYRSRYQTLKKLTIGGHTWTIDYRTTKAFDKLTSSSQPALIAVGGIVIDLLLFNIILSLNRMHKRAQKLADDRMKKISEHEQQFKSLTDNANDGIISINEQGNIVYVNSSVLRMFGYTSDMMIDRPVSMLFPVAQQMRVSEALHKPAENISNYNSELLELEGIRKSSEVFPMEFSLAFWQSGSERHSTVFVRDITERKKAELFKNQFISTVSHELRTPLTAINGSLSLVENGVTGPVGDKALDMIRNARRNSSRLAILVNDLLDTDKMASGKMRYDMQDCDVSALVERAIEINRSVAAQSRVILNYEADTTLVRALVDPDRFIQVITNLLSNAIKFSPPEGVIDIRVTLLDTKIRIAVTDHGSGIPEEFRSQIFHRFGQADSSNTRKVGGTGLGLCIVKYIVEQFNGHVDYFSDPGKQTTFFFDIPAIIPDTRLTADGS